MFYILAIIGFLYCLNRINSLTKEVDSLKKLFQGQVVLPEVPRPLTPTGEPYDSRPVPTAGLVIPPPPLMYPPDDKPNVFIEWLQKDFLVKLGAFLLLIAFGWFVSYAFANNWIGPLGRITLGVLAGIAFMVAGVMRIKNELHQGSIFTVLGSTIVLLTIFAAREMYDLFTPESALLVMFMSVVFVATVSVVYRSKSTAIAGLILASIAPFLTSAPDSDTLVIFSYLTVIVLGSLWVLAKIDALVLQLIALVIVFLYSLPFFDISVGEGREIALAFGFLFTAIFFISNSASILHRTKDEAASINVAVAAGTGVYVACWIALAVSSEWQSLLYAAWATVFASGAFMIFVRTTRRAPFYIYGAVSLGLLAAATAAILEGPMLTLAYTLEVTVLVLLVLRILKNSQVAKRLSWLFVGPILLSVPSMAGYSWQEGVFHSDFVILLTLLLCVSFTASLFITTPKDEGEVENFTGGVLAFVGAAYAMILVWLINHALFLSDQAVMFSLLIYTIVGLVLYVQGRARDNVYLKGSGAALIAFVVARLLFIDVWQMEISGRIITFLLIGVLLISTAFIKKTNHTDN